MTAANATSVQQTEGLSKSQKKRMKQKAKKLQDQQLEEQLHQQERQTNTKSMQQQKETALVESLLEQGFTKEQITKAQEQLWNAGKGGYDDVWAVSDLLMRMNGGNGMKDGDEKDDSDDDDDSDYEDDSSEEESEEDDSEDESDDSEEEDDDDNAEVEVEVDVKIVDAEIREAPLTKEDITQTNNIQDVDLAQKLQYVAREVPQLADAIFALTEWTTKSASRAELEKYFLELGKPDAKEAKYGGEGPLRSIIQRVLLFQSQQQQQMDPSTIVAGCANLIACVLLSPACNINATMNNSNGASARNSNGAAAHSSTMKKALGELLRRGRALASQISSTKANTNGDAIDASPTPQVVAMSISNFILELMQRAAEEKMQREKHALNGSDGANSNVSSGKVPVHFSSPTQAQDIVRRMESEIASLMVKMVNKQRAPQAAQQKKRNGKALPAASSAVVDLMSRRDRTKQIAEKSGVVLEVSAGCKKRFDNKGGAEDGNEADIKTGQEEKGDDGQVGNDKKKQQKIVPLFQSSDSKDELAKKIVGDLLYTSLASTVSEVQSYEAKMDAILSDVATEQMNLFTRQTRVSSKRLEVKRCMDQLRRELEELERQDEQFVKEEADISSEIDRLERRSDKEVEDLKSKISAKSGHVTVDREVRRTVEKMGELELAWIRSSSLSCDTASAASGVTSEATSIPAQQKAAGPPITELLPIKLDQYLNRARTYFQSESQCVEFLRNRVSSAEAEVLDLEREIQECTMLGMTANVENVTQNLMTLKSHVEEDIVVIDALRNDAKGMRSDLIRRVEEFIESMKDNAEGEGSDEGALTPSHIASLEGISIELTSIGFYDDLDGGLGGIFSKITKQRALFAPISVNRSPTPDIENSSHIGTVDGISPLTLPADTSTGTFNQGLTNGHAAPNRIPPATVPVAAKPAMPKFCWANKSNSVPKKASKSLLDIQREEMSAKVKDQKK